jgi:hypothetical protein
MKYYIIIFLKSKCLDELNYQIDQYEIANIARHALPIAPGPPIIK